MKRGVKMEITIPKVAKTLWTARILVIFLVLDLIVAVFSVFSLWVLLPTLILLVAQVCFLCVYLPKFFKGCKICLNDGVLTVHYGVIIKTQSIMPQARLVYIKSYATPLSKRCKVKGLIFRATRSAIFLPEIEMDKAEALVKAIKG